MSETKRYFINPIPDEGGALDELPNVICLDETPGITYYTYVRERTCRPVRKEIEWPMREGPVTRVIYECHECKAWINLMDSYCFNCGARIVREGA